jgi:tetratricopeptide (TPR) repeat protein
MSDLTGSRARWKGLAAGAAVATAVVVVLLVVLFSGHGLGEAGDLASEGESLQEEALAVARLAGDLEADGRTELARAKREEAEGLDARADALFARAEEILDRAGRRRGAENPALRILRGVVAFRRGDYARARELLGPAADAPVETPERARFLVMLGTIAADSGDRKGAVSLFERAVNADPESWNAHFQLGAARLADDAAEKALPVLERAAELAPSVGAVHNALGIAYERMLRLEKAEAAFARAALVEPHRLDYLRNLEELRKTKAARNDVAAAWKAFEEGLAHEGLAWKGLEKGAADEGVEHLVRAAEFYKMAIAGMSNFHAAHYHRGICYATLGGGRSLVRERRENLAQAAEHFRAALTGRPGWAPYRFALSRALRELGKTHEAKEVLRKILRDSPRSGRAHYELACIHAYTDEDIASARKEIELARRLGVRPDPVFLRMLDEIEAEQKIPPPTEEEKDARLSAEAAAGEGDILLASGDASAAARAYSKACDALAGFERRVLVLMRADAAEKAAAAFERAKDYRSALDSFRKALELRPADTGFRESVLRLEAIVEGLDGEDDGEDDGEAGGGGDRPEESSRGE